jgi:uncharacterized protein (TIGR02147 family)
MHQIVKGYRPLTLKTANKIIAVLELDRTEALYLTSLISYCNAKDTATREKYFQVLQDIKRKSLPSELDRDLLEYFSLWYNPVIWELVGTKGFQSDINWIAKRIVPNLKPNQVKNSLELLQRLGFITYDAEQKTYLQTVDRISSGHRVKGLALIAFHHSMIDHAKASLTAVSGDRRDISSVTLSVDNATAQRLRALIHAFQLQLLDEAERSGTGDQIYQVNIQLFPFTE